MSSATPSSVLKGWGGLLHVRSYTAGDGLPGHEIEAVAQLNSGALGFLTRRGFSLYDGARWTTEKTFEPESTPWRMATGAGDDLWAYVGAACWRRRNGTWGEITSMPIPSSRSAFFAVLKEDEGPPRLMVVGLEGVIYLFDGSTWKSIEVDSQTRGLAGVTMVDGRCLIGSLDGIIEFDPVTESLTAWDLQLPARILGMTFDSHSGGLWVVGERRLVRVDGVRSRKQRIVLSTEIAIRTGGSTTRARQRRIDSRRSPVPDFPCVPDLAGGLYFGSRFQISYYHPSTGVERLGVHTGLTTNAITCAIRDREGNVWLCSTRGANKIVSRRFRAYGVNDGLFASGVSGAIQRANGDVVLGHGGGLTVMRKKLRSITKVFLTGDRVRGRVMDLAEDSAGRLWFAGGTVGLGQLRSDGSTELYATDPPQSVVGVVAVDDGRGLWVATDFHLYRHDENSWTEVPLPSHLDAAQIRRIHFDPELGLLVATANEGVLCVSEAGVRQWTSSEPETRSTYTAWRRSNGELWAGTKNGLARLEDEGRLVLSESPRLLRPIYALTEDLSGRLWVGSDIGLHRWDGTSLVSFGRSDGLIGEEANRSAAMVTEDGKVWFGSDRGITTYDARFDVPTSHGPTVALQSLEAGGSTYNLSESHVIGHESRTLSFEFKAISFVDEDRVEVEAFLEGWDASWARPERNPDREYVFPNLPPGDYRLFLRATDVRGRRSPEVASAVITIAGPIWMQPWFLVVASVFFLLIFSGMVMLFLQRRYSSRLKVEVSARTSELREMERDQERLMRLESLGLLAGGIAHDFNNLLTSITGNASMLAEDQDAVQWRRDAIDDIGAASSKATSLASSLLTFSRGGAPLKKAAAIGEVVRDCGRLTLLGSNVRVEIDIPVDLFTVELDTGQFSQVINNLMINARQAMTTGGTIRITAWNVVEPDSRSVITEVADEGPGIAPANIQRIFDPYFTTKPGGTGFGLATASSIVRSHGGTLTVRSVVGEGATFRIMLPAAQVSGADADFGTISDTPGSRLDPAKVRTELGTKVLVMDDQESIRKVVRNILERSDCVVVEAKDGTEAVQLYQQASTEGDPFGVVLMDLTVPGGMGGLEATSRIRAIDGGARVIVASGYAEDGTLAKYEEHGFVGCLPKPFTARALCQAINEALENVMEG